MNPKTLAEATSWLFVPGDRPDRFDKAAAAGADVVIVDLEDAVAPGDKDAARAAVVAWPARGDVVVRINAPDTAWCAADIAALAGTGAALMLPKATPMALAGLAAALGSRGVPVVALVETAAGVRAADEIAVFPGVVRLALGAIDLAAELGVDPDTSPLIDRARADLAFASAAAGLAGPVDGVTTAVGDEDALRADLARATDHGMTGKLCIHPRQVATVHAGFAPSPAEIAWAERVLAVDSARSIGRRPADGGVFTLDGEMVDRPVLVRAERILARRGRGC